MIIKKPSSIKSYEITDEKLYHKRREFMKGGFSLLAASSFPMMFSKAANAGINIGQPGKTPYGQDEEITSWEDATSYNNFYEFGFDKSDPAEHAYRLKTDPWSIEVSGACEKPGTYHLEDLIKTAELEERIYRLRCVEAWSMVIPWIGVPLNRILKRFEPTSSAKYVAFETLTRPKEMIGQNSFLLEWPYREGLRMDEAMHPLTIFSVGMYGKVLPNQNGAPVRLVVPWKYGFKSIKSIVKIRFQEEQPFTTWQDQSPKEYGFYANVNPEVDHPRWSQKKERRIGAWFKYETQMFNGYADEVASLYTGMDLKKYY